jgi:hypothetical protein
MESGARNPGGMRRLCALVALAVLGLTTGAAARTTGPPPGLTESGRALWQFEALLHDVFGNRLPFASSASNDANFACAGVNCYPHAKWDPYAYTFVGARSSTFRLVSRTFRPGAFGNYPVPLRINGLYISCGAGSATFLTRVDGTAGFALSCQRPTP